MHEQFNISKFLILIKVYKVKLCMFLSYSVGDNRHGGERVAGAAGGGQQTGGGDGG